METRTFTLLLVSQAAYDEIKGKLEDVVQPDGAVLMDGLAIKPEPDDPESVEWKRRDRAGGDPHWVANLGSYSLTVTVACEWIWEWDIDHSTEGEMARGSVAVGGDEVDLDDWDYQDVAQAQARCVLVARTLVAAGVA